MFSFFFCFVICPPPRSTLFPYTTLFRSAPRALARVQRLGHRAEVGLDSRRERGCERQRRRGLFRRELEQPRAGQDRKSTRLNSSHGYISYAVFCLKKKNIKIPTKRTSIS